jgi:hypothetical protein
VASAPLSAALPDELLAPELQARGSSNENAIDPHIRFNFQPSKFLTVRWAIGIADRDKPTKFGRDQDTSPSASAQTKGRSIEAERDAVQESRRAVVMPPSFQSRHQAGPRSRDSWDL